MVLLAPSPVQKSKRPINRPGRPKQIETDSDLAEYLITDMTARAGVAPVWHHGALYEYQPKIGIWERKSRGMLASEIQKMHRKIKPEVGKGAEKGLAITSSLRESVVNCIEHFCLNDAFFSGSQGVAFENQFASITKDGITLQDHAPENRAVFGYQFQYNTETPIEWIAMLDRIFEGDEDREAKKTFIGEFLGAALLGLCPTFSRCLILQGEGSNGKSMVLEVAEALFPDNLRSNVKPQVWHQEYYAAELAGKRINIVNELPESEIIGSETFKAVITGDRITARHIRASPFHFKPQAGHIFSCNSLPGTRDQTQGFWRRVGVISFNRQFEAGLQRDSIMKSVLAEKPKIVGWVLGHTVELLRREKYQLPESSKASEDRWRLDTDSVALYVNQCCTKEPDDRELGEPLYDGFCRWALLSNHKQLTNNKFADRLKKLGFQKKRGDTGNKWVGIKLKDRESWDI